MWISTSIFLQILLYVIRIRHVKIEMLVKLGKNLRCFLILKSGAYRTRVVGFDMHISVGRTQIS